MFRTVGESTDVGRSPLNPLPRSDTVRNGRRQNRRPLREVLNRILPLSDQDASQGRSAAVKQVIQLKIDIPLLLVVVTLVIFGLLMVFSASTDFAQVVMEKDPMYVFNRQLLWLVLGVVGAVIAASLDYHYWRRLAVLAIGVTILSLIIVLIINEVRLGATRTLVRGSVQPSELAKLVTVIYLAVWLYAKRMQLGNVSFGLIPLAAILGFMGGLILLQPDLSAVVTVFALGGILFFLAGGDLRQIAVLLVIALLVGWAVVQISPTGSERLEYYIAGLKDPIEGSYHVRRSFEAFVKGGWFGVGIGRGVTKYTGLPFPHTDSIFAVVGEETGVVGAAGLVALYALLLWRGLLISRRAPDQFGALLAAGLSVWISLEAFINMAVMVNLVPFAGNALPFISAGGSSLVVSLIAIGILMNIARVSQQHQENQGRTFNALVDMRGRNRGRRVSGSHRPARYARIKRDQG